MASAEAILPEGFRLKSASGTLTISWRGPTHWVFLFAGAFGLALCGLLLAGFALTSRGSIGAPFLSGAGLLFSAYVLAGGIVQPHLHLYLRRPAAGQARPAALPLAVDFSGRVHQGNSHRRAGDAEGRSGAHRRTRQHTDPPTYAFRAVVRDGSVETLLTGMELAEARSVGRVLADSADLEVSLPEETPPVGAVCRLRRR